MTSSFSQSQKSVHPQAYHAAPIPAPVIPAGTFLPGTVITVGAHKVTIDRYLSEGGFAHVYLVRLARPVNGLDVAVLKRVAVPDKEALANMRTEVETMKRLKGHRHIVTYIDSHASHLKNGGYEVFLLMEYCSGGGLIDFMNTRLKNRLTEPEVLHIFSDVAEGVSCMHYLQPPLLHRDLKVENVLIASNNRFLLCDFGSAASVQPAGQTPQECRAIHEDVQRHTTLQYRSPEMVDVYRKLPIDEKSDIWALGVLLYKLCYYTTPFEEQGTLAILNATFRFPQYPVFSDRLKNLISLMLKEDPQKRPNIYQVVSEVCHMRGKPVPIKDVKFTSDQVLRTVIDTFVQIYTSRTGHKKLERVVSPPQPSSAPSVIAYQSPPPPKQVIPEIVPMRRGRPGKSFQPISPPSHVLPPKSTAPDPFTALDTASVISSPAEVSSRFPTVEEFDLLHQTGAKFEFDPRPESPRKDPIAVKVMEKLADEAFGFADEKPKRIDSKHTERLVAAAVKTGVTTSISSTSKTPLFFQQQQQQQLQSQQQKQQQQHQIQQQTPPQQPQMQVRPQMVSTGTMTSPPASPPSPPPKDQRKAIHGSPVIRPSEPQDSERNRLQRPNLAYIQRTSTTGIPSSLLSPSSSSRPSLEGPRPSTTVPIQSEPLPRSRSANANAQPRPSSVHIESNMDFLRDLDSGTPAQPISDLLIATSTGASSKEEHPHIISNVDFLRSMESSTTPPPSHHHSNSQGQSDNRHPRVASITKHVKRASMPSISSAGNNAKTLLQSKFGEAFRRFEHQEPAVESSSPPVSPPASSESVKSPILLDSYDDDDWDSLSPEVRREIEQQRLAAEDRRVRQAAEEYKRNVASGAPLRNQKTATILSPTATARASSLIENQRTAGPSSTQPSLLIASQIASYEQHSLRPDSPSTTKPPLPPKPTKPKQLRTGKPVVDSEPNLLGDSGEWDVKEFEKRFPSL